MTLTVAANGAISMNYKLVIAQLTGQCICAIYVCKVSAAYSLQK